MIIEYLVIPHRYQRYATVGDYFQKRGRWMFKVSKMKDRRYPVLVFLHEIIEFMLCRMAGIKVRDIDRFDMEYEQARAAGAPAAPCGCPLYAEPGKDPHAPYRDQHICAARCERLIAQAAGVEWDKYCEAVDEVTQDLHQGRKTQAAQGVREKPGRRPVGASLVEQKT